MGRKLSWHAAFDGGIFGASHADAQAA